MKSTSILMLAVVFTMAGLLAAYGTEPDGKTVFASKCTMCHGPDGKGSTKMGAKLAILDLSSPKVQAAAKDEDLIKIIKDGVSRDGFVLMRPYADKLTEAEIKACLQFIRALKSP